MKIDAVIKRNFTDITPEYEAFARDKDACRKCSIYEHYKQVGQSEGNAKNPIFIIVGEALGADETAQVRPFIGRAGQRLCQELRKYPETFNRNTTLISNVLACRPQNNVFPQESGAYTILDGDRKGKRVKGREIVNFCATNWLRREIALVEPKIIITLGAKALDYVRGDNGIGSNRGSWKFIDKYRAWTMATYHPSYILRCQNDDDKFYIVDDFANDFKKIVNDWSRLIHDDERMQMTVEEWQRERALNIAADNGLFALMGK